MPRLPVLDAEAPAGLAGILTTEGIARAYAAHAGGDLRRLGALAPGTVLREVTLAPDARAVGTAVRDLGLPPQALIVAVRRAGTTLIPRGSTVLQAGDALTVVTAVEAAAHVAGALQGLCTAVGAPSAFTRRLASPVQCQWSADERQPIASSSSRTERAMPRRAYPPAVAALMTPGCGGAHDPRLWRRS